MCGIVGIGGNLAYKDEKTMQSLLLLDYFRGTDSTGLAAVRNGGDVKIVKDATDPINLFQYPKFKDALNGNACKLFLGHNRASTSGATNRYNAHPFQCGHIVGVMNGTLEFSDKRMLEDNLGEKFDVDSEALFAAIAKYGVKETIESVHEGSDSARGAWALAWYNQEEDTLNFLRNKWRPMWLAWDKEFRKLFFASRWEFINHAAAIADTPYELERYEYTSGERKGQTYRFFHVPENQHWKFKLSDIIAGSKSRPKPAAKMISGKEPKSSGYKPPVWDPFHRQDNQVGTKKEEASSMSSTTTSKTSSHSSKDREGYGILHLYATKTNQPYSHVLTLPRFEELIQFSPKSNRGVGCSFCYADINYGDPGITVYEAQDTILCSKCSGNEKASDAPAVKIYVNPAHFAELKKAA